MPVRHGVGVGAVVGGRFRLEAELGEGGMGRVWEAVDLRHDRPAAVKIVGRRLASDPEFRARFQREASAAEHANHPHVLPVWDYGEEGDSLYLATPLCDIDVGALVYEQRGRLDVDHALRLLTQVGWALDWAHGRGVVHRDVKPENILLVHGPGEDHAYLADFGMARAATDETLTQLGHPAALSPAYAAPEQWLGLAVGPEADQYSLAATLFVCLSGRPPFYPARGEDLRRAHLEAPPPPLPEELGAPGELSSVIGRALAKKPVARFPSCGAFIASARASVGDDASTATAPEREPTEPQHPSSAGLGATVADTGGLGPPVGETADPPDELAAAARESSDRQLAATVGETAAEPAIAPLQATETDHPAPQPSLQSPSEPAAPGRTAPGRALPGRRLILLGALAAVAVVAVLVVVLAGGGSTKPGQGSVTSIPVGRRPADLAASGGAIWVANMGDNTLSQISFHGGDPRAHSVGAGTQFPTKLATGYGEALWSVSTESQLVPLNPQTGQASGGNPLMLPGEVFGISGTPDGLWVVDGQAGEATRYSVPNGRLVASRPIPVHRGAQDIAAGSSAVWVTNGDDGTLTRIDSDTLQYTRVRIAKGIGDVVVSDGFVWVADPAQGVVFRAREADGHPTNLRLRVDRAQDGLMAVGESSVFFVNKTTGVASRFDEHSGKPLGRQQVSDPDASAALVSRGSLWVADPIRNSVERLTIE